MESMRVTCIARHVAVDENVIPNSVSRVWRFLEPTWHVRTRVESKVADSHAHNHCEEDARIVAHHDEHEEVRKDEIHHVQQGNAGFVRHKIPSACTLPAHHDFTHCVSPTFGVADCEER